MKSDPLTAILSSLAGLVTLSFMGFFLWGARQDRLLHETLQKEPARIVSEMSLDQKIGALFHGAFLGPEPSPWIKRAIQEQHLGGVILFAQNLRNPEQIKELTDQLQKISTENNNLPLFISIDQEGGRVRRVTDGTTLFPGAMALGQTDRPEEVRQAAFVTGYDLKKLGINLILAPVLDVNNNPGNPVINTRSFGSDPDRVSSMGIAFAKGISDAGSTHCIKHFPGHGDTTSDSHYSLPVIRKSEEELEQVELVPFRKAIQEGAEMVMTAHVIFPGVDKKNPATLSRKILTGILRNRLGFDGVIITDAMEMNAISQNFGPGEATVRALKAGVDIILLTAENPALPEMIQAVKTALKKGRLTEEQIDRSVERQVALKLQKGLLHEHRAEYLTDSGLHKFFEKKQNDIEKEYRKLMEQYGEAQKLNVILSDMGVRSLKKDFPGLVDDGNGHSKKNIYLYYTSKELGESSLELPIPPENRKRIGSLKEVHRSLSRHRDSDQLILLVEIRASEAGRWNSLIQQKLNQSDTRVIGLYTGNPFVPLEIPPDGAVLASFSSTPESIRATARQALSGDPVKKADLILETTGPSRSGPKQ